MTPDDELETRMIDLVRRVCREHPSCHDPEALATALGLRTLRGDLAEWEGGLVGDAVVVDPSRPARRALFTAYHEIAHHLIRRDDSLLALLHDQYPRQEDFERTCERLCNIGAAEFLVPRDLVVRTWRERGFGIRLVPVLYDATGASATAVCVQLGLLAPHACVAVVARMVRMVDGEQAALLLGAEERTGLAVDVSVSSRSMKYSVARGTPIPPGHLLHTAARAHEREVVAGKDRIPFRTGRAWVVDCEALRLRSQVFALFHANRKPDWNPDQVLLPFGSGSPWGL
ncbi:MAG: ImmA/IrrE family metallo-endopeptidase [Armatimonadota bacterium]|nr:ImmA/IrrE family metallo-endopeptidase [Armatimonadota bacterium]